MIRIVIAVAIAATSTMPVFAMDMMKCDDASMMKAEDHAKMMKGEAMTMAMKDVDMAKTAKKEGKTDDCMMHLNKAMNAK